MRGSRGGVGGGPDPPPLEFAKLNIADITGNEKKIVIFHICALPQLNVKVGPPLEIFSGSAPALDCLGTIYVHCTYVHI